MSIANQFSYSCLWILIAAHSMIRNNIQEKAVLPILTGISVRMRPSNKMHMEMYA